MPFIDNNFKISTPIQAKRILMTAADDSPVYKAAENLARFLQHQNQNILLIDGDLGNGANENPNLSQVLRDKGAITKAIRKIQNVAVLGGKSDYSLAQTSPCFQLQFLSDLQLYEEHFNRTITAIGPQNVQLQNLWLEWADKTILFFKNNNIFLEKTAEFLSLYKNKISGLIGIDTNLHETRLAWMRIKEIVPETPDLILDIKKIAL